MDITAPTSLKRTIGTYLLGVPFAAYGVAYEHIPTLVIAAGLLLASAVYLIRYMRGAP